MAITRVGGARLFRLHRRMVGLLLLLVACVMAASLGDESTIVTMAWILTLALGSTILVAWSGARGLTGASAAYVLVFGLFHCGLIFAVAIGGDHLLVGGGDNTWIYGSGLKQAVFAVCLALAALSLGIAIGQRGVDNRAVLPEMASGSEPRIAIAGGVALLLGIITMITVLASSGGLSLIFSGYGKFLEALGSDGAFGYGTILCGFGVGFLVAAGGHARRMGWITLLALAAIALPLGLRGTALFLIVAVLTVEAKRRRLSMWMITTGAYFSLLAISVLRHTRADGIEGLLRGGWSQAVPLEAIAEMGYSLLPVVVVQEWLDGGVPYQNGATLISPVLRIIENVVGGGAPPGASDFRLFNVEIMSRVGAIGGSPVAEGLRNGGPVFVVVLMVAIGFVVARVDGLPATPVGGAVTVVVMLPLLITIRNSFAPVAFQLAIGGAMLLLAEVLAKRQRNQSNIAARS